LRYARIGKSTRLMSQETRIAMVDDHGLFRESLGRLLESHEDFLVVARCGTVSEALAGLSQTPADVVLLDYDLGDQTALSLLHQIRTRWRETRILMVTAGLSEEAAVQVMEAGAVGIFLKHNNPERLAVAIRRVAAGEVWLDDDSFQSLLAGGTHRTASHGRTRPLTMRQSEVLRGILDGLTNKEIAAKLKTSETSVKAVIQELFQKAGVRTRSQLVRIAIEKHSADWLGSHLQS
jgi:two-component system, NarL family, nitrate/nitrite response regulator NarL